jgi:hypothetical protein
VLFPNRIKVIPHAFDDRATFRTWLIEDEFRNCFDDPRAQNHSTSPFCWFGQTEDEGYSKENIDSFLGGHDDTL